MVYQTSGITIPLNCKSTSRRTIGQLPLTICNGLGVFDKLFNQIFSVRGESGEVSKARKSSKMQRTIIRELRNIGRKECELPTDKPILLESYEEHAEDHNHTKNEEIPRITQEDLERIKPSKQQSNHRLLWLAIVTCLILIVVLLGGLLILSKKISHGCGCSEEKGPQRLKSQPPRRISSEENGTNLSDLVEYISSDLNELRAAVNGTKNDLAKLNRTVTTVQSTLNSTSNDLSDLESSVTKVQSRSDRTSDDVSVLNYTVNKLNKAIQRGLSEWCQNVTRNSTSEECKSNCCRAVNSREETPPAVESCKELHNTNGSDANKAYLLRLGKKILPVYCHMTALDGCGGGGWTLVMKMDGSKDTFHYNQLIWSNQLNYNPSAGTTGFDGEETMLPSYWETKFSRICLGMKNGKEINFIAINVTASSLYSLIADGQYRNTSLGRDKWKSLLRFDASLQSNCNREGFNVLGGWSGAFQPRARIGILGNQENNCRSCDSRIGFGTGGHPDYSNSCGNVAMHHADNGDKNIKTMGYILVQ